MTNNPLSETESQNDRYTTLVHEVMDITSITWGEAVDDFWQHPDDGYIVKFIGPLRIGQAEAQTYLKQELRGKRITAVIQEETDGDFQILLVRDTLSNLIGQYFDIEETRWGTVNEPFAVQFLGQMKGDSMEAYDTIADAVRPREMTPLFRENEGTQAIILLKGVNRPTPSNPWVNLVMFILTGLSVLYVGVLLSYEGPLDVTLWEMFQASAGKTIGFGTALLAILSAHELGHYFAGRFHKTAVTLPYFLPLPIPPFGTLGAFIQLKESPKNRRVLLDIGAAGPFAGLIVAIPVLFIGLSLSTVDTLPTLIPAGQGFSLEGNSILYLLAKYVVFGEWLPSPATFGDSSPLVYWLQFFFTGRPFPFGGRDVLIHPVAFAGWGGILVTALNLIPAGQLDGGHLLYVLVGSKAKRLLPVLVVILLGMGLLWSGWFLWAALIFFLGRAHAEPLDQITKLDSRRRAVAIFGLVIFFLVFTPIPLQFIVGPVG